MFFCLVAKCRRNIITYGCVPPTPRIFQNRFGDTLGTSFFFQNLAASQALLMGVFSFPPLFHIANLFLLISSILGSRTAGPHTQFVQWFMEECVDCLEQGSRGSILQFMPFTTVSAPPPPAQPAPVQLRAGQQVSGELRVQWPVGRGLFPQASRPSPPGSAAVCLTGIGTGEGVGHVQPQGSSGHHGPQPALGPPGGRQSHRRPLRGLAWPRGLAGGFQPCAPRKGTCRTMSHRCSHAHDVTSPGQFPDLSPAPDF